MSGCLKSVVLEATLFFGGGMGGSFVRAVLFVISWMKGGSVL